MNSTIDNFRKAFEDYMVEHGATIQLDENEIYSIAQISMPERIVTLRLIGSQPIIEELHGSKNNTEIKAIGYFSFKWSTQDYEPNFYVFAFNNLTESKVEFAVIPYAKLKKRLELRNSFIVKDYWTELQFWLMPPENSLFDTTNIGAEGEYWLACGSKSKHMRVEYTDYTEFLNGFDQLTNH
jgi:hypothetical protein